MYGFTALTAIIFIISRKANNYINFVKPKASMNSILLGKRIPSSTNHRLRLVYHKGQTVV